MDDIDFELLIYKLKNDRKRIGSSVWRIDNGSISFIICPYNYDAIITDFIKQNDVLLFESLRIPAILESLGFDFKAIE